MRNPDRIPEIIELLQKAWELVPDWRLGQLIYNMAGKDPFYMEEKELKEKLEHLIEIYERK